MVISLPSVAQYKLVYTERSEVVGDEGIEPSTSSLSETRSTTELVALILLNLTIKLMALPCLCKLALQASLIKFKSEQAVNQNKFGSRRSPVDDAFAKSLPRI